MGMVLRQHGQKDKCLRWEKGGYSAFPRIDRVKHRMQGWARSPCQILERILQQMAVSPQKRMLIARPQHGFTRRKSCPIADLCSGDTVDQQLRRACLPVIHEGSTSRSASSLYSDSPLDPTPMCPHREVDPNLWGAKYPWKMS